MIHFLRNNLNTTIVDCEVTKNDLRCVISIASYTEFYTRLYDLDKETALEFRDAIDSISEIRGWWWEREKDNPKWKSIEDFVKFVFTEYATRWELTYMTD